MIKKKQYRGLSKNHGFPVLMHVIHRVCISDWKMIDLCASSKLAQLDWLKFGFLGKRSEHYGCADCY